MIHTYPKIKEQETRDMTDSTTTPPSLLDTTSQSKGKNKKGELTMREKGKFKQRVFETATELTTLTLMEWGNGYRVKCVTTDRDPNKTHVLSSWDMEYDSEYEATRRFGGVVRAMWRTR